MLDFHLLNILKHYMVSFANLCVIKHFVNFLELK